jgi:hemin uptake protein HemP
VNLPPTNESLESDGQPSSKIDATREELALGALPKIIKFDALARCGDEIWIENEGQIYRLRKTRQGKLILTK